MARVVGAMLTLLMVFVLYGLINMVKGLVFAKNNMAKRLEACFRGLVYTMMFRNQVMFVHFHLLELVAIAATMGPRHTHKPSMALIQRLKNTRNISMPFSQRILESTRDNNLMQTMPISLRNYHSWPLMGVKAIQIKSRRGPLYSRFDKIGKGSPDGLSQVACLQILLEHDKIHTRLYGINLR